MRLLIQPGEGVLPMVKAIAAAKKSIETVIFRFDQREVERALANAVSRGVFVHALIAHTNRAGEDGLRKLEMRLLAAGANVARTADDLVRYHAKLMIIDGRELHLMAFNFTHLDIEHSRSFGIITSTRESVRAASKLFEADTKRHPYEAELASFVVSPVNARQELAKLIQSAKKVLLIYDPRISDPAMIRLLEARAKAGVEIRILGQLTRRIPGIQVLKLAPVRLHTRTIVSDNRTGFIGSQSLRALELDGRREAGIVFRDPKVVSGIVKTFEADWAASQQAGQQAEKDATDTPAAARVAKKVAKAVSKDMGPVTELVNGAMDEMMGAASNVEVNSEELEAVVKDAVKTAVADAIRNAVEDAVEQDGIERTQ